MWLILNIFQALLIVVITLASSVVSLFMPLIGQRKAALWIARKIWAPFLLKLVGGKVEVIHPENIDLSIPQIIVANHSSHFDIPILFANINYPIYFIAKKELKRIPFFGWACSAVGMVWIDRKNKGSAAQSMRDAGEQIKKGKTIITFPEGTRTKTGQINQFKRGSFALALATGLDIMPICIINSRPLNPPGKFSFRPARVKLIFGDKICTADHMNKTPEQYAKYVEWQISLMYQKYMD
jgi:1-acyl-sn-glycerol-3-phosphate acyltransferase